MKLFILAILTFAIADAAPVESSGTATIIRQEYERTEDGYSFEYETSDGQTRQESGNLVTDEEGNQYLQVRGSFSYVGPDGKTIRGSYTADKNGYQFFPPIDHGLEPSVGIPNSALISLVG